MRRGMEGGGGGLFQMESAAPEAQAVLWLEADVTSWACPPQAASSGALLLLCHCQNPGTKSSTSFLCGLGGERTPGRTSVSTWGLRCGLHYCCYSQVHRSSSETPVETYKSYGPSKPLRLPSRRKLLLIGTCFFASQLTVTGGHS